MEAPPGPALHRSLDLATYRLCPLRDALLRSMRQFHLVMTHFPDWSLSHRVYQREIGHSIMKYIIISRRICV